MTQAIGYTRCSTHEQADSGLGLKARLIASWDRVDGDAKPDAMAESDFPLYFRKVYSMLPRTSELEISGQIIRHACLRHRPFLRRA